MVILTFTEICYLAVIKEYQERNISAPGTYDLIDRNGTATVFNRWIEQHDVSPFRQMPITAYETTTNALDTLKEAGLIIQAKYRPYQVSQSGYRLMRELGDNWKDWPSELPIEDGQPDFSLVRW